MARLAFLISAHTDAEHLRRLLGSLPREADKYIHVDLKADIAGFTAVTDDPRAHFTTRRTNIVWGSVLQVEYQMQLIRDVLDSGREYDYLISMSGQDYPLWSNARINRYFDAAAGREILHGICLAGLDYARRDYTVYRPLNDRPWPFGSVRSKLRVALRHLLKAVGVRKQLSFTAGGRHYRLHKGGSWWAITPRLARHALSEWEGNSALRRYFRTSFAPDETFLQTVAFSSSEFAPRCTLHEGDYRSLAELTPLTYIDYNPVIKILTEEDFPALVASGKMFCRKTVTGRSDRLMDMIDARRAEEDAAMGGADKIK